MKGFRWYSLINQTKFAYVLDIVYRMRLISFQSSVMPLVISFFPAKKEKKAKQKEKYQRLILFSTLKDQKLAFKKDR